MALLLPFNAPAGAAESSLPPKAVGIVLSHSRSRGDLKGSISILEKVVQGLPPGTHISLFALGQEQDEMNRSHGKFTGILIQEPILDRSVISSWLSRLKERSYPFWAQNFFSWLPDSEERSGPPALFEVEALSNNVLAKIAMYLRDVHPYASRTLIVVDSSRATLGLMDRNEKLLSCYQSEIEATGARMGWIGIVDKGDLKSVRSCVERLRESSPVIAEHRLDYAEAEIKSFVRKLSAKTLTRSPDRRFPPTELVLQTEWPKSLPANLRSELEEIGMSPYIETRYGFVIASKYLKNFELFNRMFSGMPPEIPKHSSNHKERYLNPLETYYDAVLSRSDSLGKARLENLKSRDVKLKARKKPDELRGVYRGNLKYVGETRVLPVFDRASSKKTSVKYRSLYSPSLGVPECELANASVDSEVTLVRGTELRIIHVSNEKSGRVRLLLESRAKDLSAYLICRPPFGADMTLGLLIHIVGDDFIPTPADFRSSSFLEENLPVFESQLESRGESLVRRKVAQFGWPLEDDLYIWISEVPVSLMLRKVQVLPMRFRGESGPARCYATLSYLDWKLFRKSILYGTMGEISQNINRPYSVDAHMRRNMKRDGEFMRIEYGPIQIGCQIDVQMQSLRNVVEILKQNGFDAMLLRSESEYGHRAAPSDPLDSPAVRARNKEHWHKKFSSLKLQETDLAAAGIRWVFLPKYGDDTHFPIRSRATGSCVLASLTAGAQTSLEPGELLTLVSSKSMGRRWTSVWVTAEGNDVTLDCEGVTDSLGQVLREWEDQIEPAVQGF